MSVPPGQPRLRRWQPPAIGTRFRRKIDGVELKVQQVYRANRQVLLGNGERSHRCYVFAHDLARDWEQVS